MTQLTVQGREVDAYRVPLLDAGFRPFFLAAAAFAVASVAAWTLVYTFGWRLHLGGMSAFHWHAHEMIYGYVMAVIAGFLLTAIEKWTGVPRCRGPILIVLLVLWAAPRGLMLFGTRFAVAAGCFDLVFIAALAVLITRPIVVSRQWSQLGILIKLLVLLTGQACFLLGSLAVWAQGARVGVYLGFFLVVGLILTVARRVLPQFIKSGLPQPVRLFNSRWIDALLVLLYVPYVVAELIPLDLRITGGLAMALFLGHAARLAGWYTNGIWSRPLLWSLYLSIVWIDVGFLLVALSSVGLVSRYLALHAMAYGGIGLVTLSMMVRVALGHTGRSVHKPPVVIGLGLACLAAGAVIRILLPWMMIEHYRACVAAAQMLWLLAFAGYLIAYTRILTTPSVATN